MEEAKIEAKQQHPQPDGSFTMRLGNTTYLIGMHFKRRKETVTDKIKAPCGKKSRQTAREKMFTNFFDIYLKNTCPKDSIPFEKLILFCIQHWIMVKCWILTWKRDNRANLDLWHVNGTSAQKFIVVKNTNGTYSFAAYCSGVIWMWRMAFIREGRMSASMTQRNRVTVLGAGSEQ